MHIGENKSSAFDFIAERVSNNLQRWKIKAISKGRKLVLLKMAAQSIPNFWMNLFQIPTEVCTKIQRSMNLFWWRNGRSGRGVRWLAWEKLCEPKAGGGLGFRELNKFNVDMLSKQGWRLLNNENPLVTSTMKAKYYLNSDFLNAKVGANPIYMCRSIMATQQVIKEGSGRHIGSGEDTYMWRIPWLPCQTNGYMTTNMPIELENIKVVSSMIEDGNRWDAEVLEDICNTRDKNLIKRIPIQYGHVEDSWFWLQ